MGLNRCIVCAKVTPEPDTAFCGDACTEAWQEKAVETMRQIHEEIALESEAVSAVLEAQRTGLWN